MVMLSRKSHPEHVIGLLMSALLLLVETSGSYVDYTENTELIQQRAGYDITLECGLRGLIAENKMAEIKIHWYFKQCSETPAGTKNCADSNEDEWTKLPCEESFCKPDLHLRNVTEKYSGLYKCTVYPYRLDAEHTLDIQLVRTYQLDVKNTSQAVPEFLDQLPLNKTASVGDQVVFQCRVYSIEHPTVKWFRRKPEFSANTDQPLGGNNLSGHIVRYNGNTYELLPTAREKFIGDDSYLSKLILNGVRLQDQGHYACAAISYTGYSIREAYLRVRQNDNEKYTTVHAGEADEAHTDPREFWLLFLMPLGLAMLPISVWLCYIVLKKGRRGAPMKTVEQQHLNEDHCALRL